MEFQVWRLLEIITISNQITRIEHRAASADCHGTLPLHRCGFIPIPPVDFHCFFKISIRTEKKIQLELKKNFSNFVLKKKNELVYTDFFFSSN